nr:hypothetical protein [Paraburkholderia sp. BL8N3]
MIAARIRTAINRPILESGPTPHAFGAFFRISEIECSARRKRFANVELGSVAAAAFVLYEPTMAERRPRATMTSRMISGHSTTNKARPVTRIRND